MTACLYACLLVTSLLISLVLHISHSSLTNGSLSLFNANSYEDRVDASHNEADNDEVAFLNAVSEVQSPNYQ